MSDFIDDFLSGLEADKQQPRTNNGIVKMLMSAPDNQGAVLFAPFQDTATKQFYKLIRGCKELKTTISTYKDGNDAVWVKILPKEFYDDLTPAQSELYDRVVGLFDQYDEQLGDIPRKWESIRTRSYSLFQGVLTGQVNKAGTVVTDNVGKAVLLIFPARNPINELATAIQTKKAAMNNSTEWIPAIFAPGPTGRMGVVTISFSKPDSPGYNCSVGFEVNSAINKVVSEEGFPEDVVSQFGDMVSEFLGWQNGDGSKFNTTNFTELEKILTIELNKLNTGAPSNPQVENKNGVDPMISAQPQSSAPTAN